jgi:hypothetical protein
MKICLQKSEQEIGNFRVKKEFVEESSISAVRQ